MGYRGAETIPSNMHLDLKQLREFANRYTAAWCSQNAAIVASFYSPEGSLTINDGPPAVGRHNITEAAQGFMTAFPDLQIVMDDVVERDDMTEYHWTLLGTNTGPGGTRSRVRISGFELWQIGDDGLIAKSRGKFDHAEFQRQLNESASPAKNEGNSSTEPRA
jgi:SnoaL-like polyketide cyclase